MNVQPAFSYELHGTTLMHDVPTLEHNSTILELEGTILEHKSVILQYDDSTLGYGLTFDQRLNHHTQGPYRRAPGVKGVGRNM